MNAQLSHANSQLVTRHDLLTIAPPPSTNTWRPIAHADLITAIDRQLLVRGITIKTETFAIQHQIEGIQATPLGDQSRYVSLASRGQMEG